MLTGVDIDGVTPKHTILKTVKYFFTDFPNLIVHEEYMYRVFNS